MPVDGAVPVWVVSLRTRVSSLAVDIAAKEQCPLMILAIEITAPLQYIIQQLASLDWGGEGQIIPVVKAFNHGLELILSSGHKVLKVIESFSFQ